MSLSKSLTRLRKGNGITQAKMAEKLGITTAYYGRLEKKGEELSIIQLTKIADILNISLKELLFGKKEPDLSTETKLEIETLKNKALSLELECNNALNGSNEVMKLFITFWFGLDKKEIYDRFKEKDSGEGFYVSSAGNSSENWVKSSDLLNYLIEKLPHNVLTSINLDLIRTSFMTFFNLHKLTFLKLPSGKISITAQVY